MRGRGRCLSSVWACPVFSHRFSQPIRTPGAVQGFGVLVALQDDPDSETLVVRQVSENATELLGLSPKYLFSLPCFTDVLPDSQVDVLWDNIQFLADPDAGG